MNKAFVREPDFEVHTRCPRCGTIARHVWSGPLDKYLSPDDRSRLGEEAWYCPASQCDVSYFHPGGAEIPVSSLQGPVYPYDLDAPMCACFGLGYDEVEKDVEEGHPSRLKDLYARSRSPEANCSQLAVDGRCCMAAIQELYLKLKGRSESSSR